MCARYGWTYDYLLWGVTWRTLHMMAVDAPVYKYKKGKAAQGNAEPAGETKGTKQQFKNFLSRF